MSTFEWIVWIFVAVNAVSAVVCGCLSWHYKRKAERIYREIRQRDRSHA